MEENLATFKRTLDDAVCKIDNVRLDVSDLKRDVSSLVPLHSQIVEMTRALNIMADTIQGLRDALGIKRGTKTVKVNPTETPESEPEEPLSPPKNDNLKKGPNAKPKKRNYND